MPTAVEKIVAAIKSETLPSKSDELFADIYDPAANIFYEQELTYCDYKAEFPHSLSDDYFGGILRLVCAFYNTFGGIIVFGVHDTARDPGHNKVKVNIERF